MKALQRCLYVVIATALVIPSVSNSQTTTPSAEQLAADQAACQQHAMASSGYNPDSQSSETKPQRGAGLRGAARGAAKGAIIGGTVEVIGDDSKYDDAAEIGAGVGAVAGGARSRRQAKEQAQAAPTTGDPSAYTKSYNDCMKSRGHTIE